MYSKVMRILIKYDQDFFLLFRPADIFEQSYSTLILILANQFLKISHDNIQISIEVKHSLIYVYKGWFSRNLHNFGKW